MPATQAQLPPIPLRFLTKLFPQAQMVRFISGEEVFVQNTSAHAIYYIAKGKVQVYRKLRNGGILDLATLSVGHFVGEMALLTSGKRSANVRALGEVRLLEIRATHFMEVLRCPDPMAHRIALHLCQLLSWRMFDLVELCAREAERQDLTGGKNRTALPQILRQIHSHCPV